MKIHLLSLLSLFFVVFAMAADRTPQSGIEWKGDADDAVAHALKHNPLLVAAQSDVDISEASLRSAWGQYVPRITFHSLLTAVPTMRGDALDGYTDFDEWGPLFRVEVDGKVPLYAFGQLSALRDVAQAGVDVAESMRMVTRQEIDFQTRRAILGWQLGMAVGRIVDEGKTYLDRAKRRLEELEEADAPDFDQVDLLKMRVYEADIIERRVAIERGVIEAREGLKLAMGLPHDAVVILDEDRLRPFPFEVLSLKAYIELAMTHRPELKVQEAKVLRARMKVRKSERALMPRLGVEGFYRYAISPVADDQLSPFAYDPYNEHEVGVGLTLRWTFDLGQQLAEMDEARARAQKEGSRLESAIRELEAEMARVYAELEAQRKLIHVNKRALKAARGWLVAKSDLYDSGFGILDDISDALVEFYTRKIGYLQSVHDANLAILRMSRIAGFDLRQMDKENSPENGDSK